MPVKLTPEQVEGFVECQIESRESGATYLMRATAVSLKGGSLFVLPRWTAKRFPGRSEGEWVWSSEKGWAPLVLDNYELLPCNEWGVQLCMVTGLREVRIFQRNSGRLGEHEEPDFLGINEGLEGHQSDYL
jgi:hypothetical protein